MDGAHPRNTPALMLSDFNFDQWFRRFLLKEKVTDKALLSMIDHTRSTLSMFCSGDELKLPKKFFGMCLKVTKQSH